MLGSQVEMISLYAKWHIDTGMHVLEDEDDKIKNKVLDVVNTPNLKDFIKQTRRQKRLTMGMNKFIGEFQIPVYNNLKHYNFYDTLDALIKFVFTEDHKRKYYERQERIENCIRSGEDLPFFDTINEGSKEFDDLSPEDAEVWLEVNDENF